MPTIAFVSPKGGAGKTTSAFLLSTALAKLQEVTVIDADPNHPIQTWANGGNTPPGLTIISDVDEDTIIERIEDAASKTPFVVVDLEGTASLVGICWIDGLPTRKSTVYVTSLCQLMPAPHPGTE